MSTGKFEALADSVFLSVRAWFRGELAKTVGPLEKRIDAVQTIKGDRGDIGSQGPAGDAGQDGAQGPQGDRGADGAVGPQGDAGARGDPGTAGADGVRGDIGPQGLPGDRGEVGPQGEKGADGLIGKTGEPGARGDVGPQGDRGADGLNAFELAKRSGFVGSEAEWHLSLRGKDGAKGIDGQNGQDGREGRPGERGRDAVSMASEIVDGIDETRSYGEGTFAVLRGGTWIARRLTDPVADGNYRDAGWLCLWRGIDDVWDEIEDGGRVVVRNIKLSDGTVQITRETTAAIVYRGTFQSGRAYASGDATTYGGSLFIAQRNTEKPPGDGDAWKLAAKRGKDGRDPS